MFISLMKWAKTGLTQVVRVQTCTQNYGLSACPNRLCDQFCSQTSGLWMLIGTLHKLWRGQRAWLSTWASWLHWVAVQSIQMDSLAVPFSYICFLIIMSPTIKSKPLIHGNKSQGLVKSLQKIAKAWRRMWSSLASSFVRINLGWTNQSEWLIWKSSSID